MVDRSGAAVPTHETRELRRFEGLIGGLELVGRPPAGRQDVDPLVLGPPGVGEREPGGADDVELAVAAVVVGEVPHDGEVPRPHRLPRVVDHDAGLLAQLPHRGVAVRLPRVDPAAGGDPAVRAVGRRRPCVHEEHTVVGVEQDDPGGAAEAWLRGHPVDVTA
ncbi:hypothetical protein Cus16_0339 [Curtobacterium sp. ER1/6]|nr:hypothetical protein Cus16_0339 [Curtobacterium sp. ER1/6]